MIEWSARIDDLLAFLAREFQMQDRVALQILLAGMVDCPRTPTLWLILETNWFSRDCQPGWFSFGETWVPESLARVRARQPWRPVVAELNDWLENPDLERLFIEPDWERYPHYVNMPSALYVLDRCPRVRLILPRTATALGVLDQRNEERRAQALSDWTRAILEDRAGARPESPPQFRQPPDFLYHIELVQRLSPWYRDWNNLLRAFASLAVRHAYLFGRSEVDASDWAILARSARDSVPVWITKAVESLAAGNSKASTLERIMNLREETKRTGHGAHRELTRLSKAGLLEWDAKAMVWKLVAEHAPAIAKIVSGAAFTKDARAA